MATFNNSTISLGNNAKLGFKIGTEANLKALTTISAGTFYLTSDTHRLYIGESQNKIAPISPGVITVEALENLPSTDMAAGQFYYVSGKNILCVYNGKEWVQINSNTYVNDSVVTQTAADNVATIGITLKRTNDTTNTGVKLDDIKLKATNGITLTKDDSGAFVFTGTVTDHKLDTSSVAAVTGVSAGAAINLKDGTKQLSSVSIVGSSTTTVSKLSAGQIQVNANTGIANNGVTVTAKSDSGFSIKVAAKDGSSATGTLKPQVKLGTNTAVNFVNGVATLDAYTKSEVDTKIATELKSLDAMTFKGTVGSEVSKKALPDTGNKNGDTYKVVGTLTVGSIKASTGDLFVATGTEAEGVITSNLEWVHIPSGDDVNTTYQGAAVDHGMSIKDSANNVVASLALTTEANGYITLTDTKTNSNSANSVQVKHAKPNNGAGATAVADDANQPAAAVTYTIPVPTVNYDSYGHITSVTNKNYQIDTTQAKFSQAKSSVAASVSSNVATIKSTMGLDNNSTAYTSAKIGSSNLAITASGSQVDINFEWGTF